jgi:dienelactone hydrolase
MVKLSRRTALAAPLAALATPSLALAAEVEPPPSLGNLFAPIGDYACRFKPQLSFLNDRFQRLDDWKRLARQAYAARLAYAPPTVPFGARVLSTAQKNGYSQDELVFRTSPYTEVSARLLKPENPLLGKPGLVALHDHGGFYYLGKEKITENDDEPAVLTEFKQRTYGGRSFASDFARAGFAVLAIDAYYFGSRRLDPASLPPGRADSLRDLSPGSSQYISTYNRFAGSYEPLMAKTIFLSGATWPGILLWDDLRSVDYLKSRPEVNPNRIGCVGLSGGGLRAATLGGMHPSIRSTVVCCFMSTAAALLRADVEHHTWMMYVPHVFAELDLPDVASMAAPNRLLVQYGTKDALFNETGQRDSAAKLQLVYRKAGCADRFRASFHDGPHGFSVPMQEEALRWFKDSLR